ncbi:MAG: DUF7716 domain-containing protein [Phycisphaeraceae bacterium]
MELPFKKTSTIGWFARNLAEWQSDGWLFIPKEQSLGLDTPCFLQGWNSRELSPEEQDDLDDQVQKAGLRSFLEWGQIDMIIGNLQAQRPNYSESELLKAIQHYWDRDAYIRFS